MTREEQLGVLESLLFAAGDAGLSTEQLTGVMEITHIEALNLLELLSERYNDNPDRGLILLELAGTFQLATKKAHAEYLRKLVEVPSNTVLSQASLETLAIIAYRQPVTRMEVDEVRGVQTDGPIRTLVAKGLVTDKGRVDGAGRAKLYVTTSEFLDAFGLNSLDDLPKLADPEAEEPDQSEMDLFFDRFNQNKEQEEE
ncbi:SMC-Scp complex subunit ScpB [Listeria seeligeri]|uniref:Segregation and condensation protein B n=2 Tax=Listeria seeligeri TaxID=1640 RepID=A0ABR5E9T5_LISSE|nr:SMC-Scp complex subunit ScpB [Listeria seeligeri]EFR99593.1 segregation and condensation protein B [Listeria seeligeri FSL N1-067]KKD47160.1 segregation and condensation protein B [Listeria seeligeri]MBC1421156.1 SMC-Scp complex subunit ScpB [Listeria seeligeri]MBC1424544.1 SMC-Scp complex subunit ScpB [Listeria seeligeri]MBC1429721.1 SMC-Scp complex subunit ScpB [Listeria seeligeri]